MGFVKGVYIVVVAAFIALFVQFGIATFYPAPPFPEPPRPSVAVVPRPPLPAGQEYRPTPAEEERLKQEKQQWQEFERRQEEYRQRENGYRRIVFFIASSLGLIVFAISFFFPRMPEILNSGMLLGGLFTYIYGIIQAFRPMDNSLRFIAIGVGLAALVYLGYSKLRERRNAA